MKAQWIGLAARFDAMSLRERVLVAVGAIVTIIYLSYSLLIDPLVVAKPRLQQAIEQERAMVKSLDAVITKDHRAEERAVKLAYRDALRKQALELSESLRTMQKELVPPEQMAKLLEGVIVRVRNVELVSLRKLPVQRARAGKPQPAETGARKNPAAEKRSDIALPDQGIYEHGFEITIQGSYAGLHDYLVRLERLPWRMLWGRLSLDAERHPDIRLTLVAHTLSLDRTWLTI